MIEMIDRLEAEHERRVAVLLEHDGREQRRLEAMRDAVADDAAKAAERGAAAGLLVVGKAIEILLHRQRCAEARDEPPLARGE